MSQTPSGGDEVMTGMSATSPRGVLTHGDAAYEDRGFVASPTHRPHADDTGLSRAMASA